ncbi:MAG: cyclic pyranopterin monophosphate synthase MoaC [Firmicutes bacterium]|nr:cyclic pyranopterin monophosphate synthase MoaC [Bacillota bacterium]
MVDVSPKPETARQAVAHCRVSLDRTTADRLLAGELPKGDALAVARVAGILAAKRTWELIPLCHPLELGAVNVDFFLEPGPEPVGPDLTRRVDLGVEARVSLVGRTGAEMEALTACAVAALTVYDMVKAVDRDVVIGDLRLVKKSGGRSGTWVREQEGRIPDGR